MNFFAAWTDEQVRQHNERVAAGCKKILADGGASPQARAPRPDSHTAVERPRAVRTNRKNGMNGTEAKFFEILKARFPASEIRYNFRLRISDWLAPVAVHYKPDFLVVRGLGIKHAIAFEVKHKERPYHSDELTRPKMARQNNPGLSAVWLATFDKPTGKFIEKLIA